MPLQLNTIYDIYPQREKKHQIRNEKNVFVQWHLAEFADCIHLKEKIGVTISKVYVLFLAIQCPQVVFVKDVETSGCILACMIPPLRVTQVIDVQIIHTAAWRKKLHHFIMCL